MQRSPDSRSYLAERDSTHCSRPGGSPQVHALTGKHSASHVEVNPMNTQPFRISRRTVKAAALMLIIAQSSLVPALAQQPADVPNTQSSRTAAVIDRFNRAFGYVSLA